MSIVQYLCSRGFLTYNKFRDATFLNKVEMFFSRLRRNPVFVREFMSGRIRLGALCCSRKCYSHGKEIEYYVNLKTATLLSNYESLVGDGIDYLVIKELNPTFSRED